MLVTELRSSQHVDGSRRNRSKRLCASRRACPLHFLTIATTASSARPEMLIVTVPRDLRSRFASRQRYDVNAQPGHRGMREARIRRSRTRQKRGYRPTLSGAPSLTARDFLVPRAVTPKHTERRRSLVLDVGLPDLFTVGAHDRVIGVRL